jgi:hypothetical protein
MHTLFASPHLELEAKKYGVQRVIAKAAGHTLVPAIEEALAQVPPREDALPPPAIAIPPTVDSAPLPAPAQEPATPSSTPVIETAASAFPAQFLPGRLLPLHADWQVAFQAALREQDPAKIQLACEQARLLMNNSVTALNDQGHATDSPERVALEDALRQLALHELRATNGRAVNKTIAN